MSPTSLSLVFDIATTDGVVRAPSAFSIICGSPPRTSAIAEFVVPRSMPKILPMIVFDDYLCRPDNFFSHTIAAALHRFNHMIFIRIVGVDLPQGFVPMRIKFPARGAKPLDALPRYRGDKLFVHQLKLFVVRRVP